MGDEHEKEQRIRERAYYIWLAEGQPEGRAEKHWESAKAESAAEDRRDGKAKAPIPGP
jgi:Protein of unknown function (DUF2934)